MKKCSKCKKEKERSEFHKHSGNPDGLRYKCRGCQKEYHKQWRQENREAQLEYQKQWHEANRASRLEQMKKRRDEQPAGVYRLRFSDGSVYVGESSCLQKRWRLHKSDFKNETRTSQALQAKHDEFGLPDFRVLLKMDPNTPKKELLKKEKMIIEGYLRRGYEVLNDPNHDDSQKRFRAISPEAKVYFSDNQNAFAREHGLHVGNLNKVLKGRNKTHRGWRFEYVG